MSEKLSPGGIYTFTDPEPLGEFKTREEKLVEQNASVKGWTCQCLSGVEVYPRGALPFPGPEDKAGWENFLSYLEPITHEQELEEGMEVIFQNLFGGLTVAKVFRDSHGELHADSGGSVYNLVFGQDDRHCWVTTCGVNTRSIQKVADGKQP